MTTLALTLFELFPLDVFGRDFFRLMILHEAEQVMSLAIQTMTVGGEAFNKIMDCSGQS